MTESGLPWPRLGRYIRMKIDVAWGLTLYCAHAILYLRPAIWPAPARIAVMTSTAVATNGASETPVNISFTFHMPIKLKEAIADAAKSDGKTEAQWLREYLASELNVELPANT